jgi:hypothetical protein
MRNDDMQAPDSPCYLAHTRRRDHMYLVVHNTLHTSRRDNHGMTSRSPICMMTRNRSWF